MSRVRDAVVALDDDASLLLGVLYLDAWLFRVPTPSFFTLERERADPSSGGREG